MQKSDITIAMLFSCLEKLDYSIFRNGDYNLNVIGIRTDSKVSNTFDDFICLVYKVKGVWVLKVSSATTDPGVYWREHPINRKGAAILVPGQYSGAYKIGKHQGKYTALVQRKPLPVYRDNNKDGVIDYTDVIDTGFHGINIHRASSKWKSKLVGKWSAGCQVFANPVEYDKFMFTCQVSADMYGEGCTYTLIEEKDLRA